MLNALSLAQNQYHTIVIGAGPTGLATSYLLKQKNIRHILLEKSDKVAASWYALWDNFRMAMPASQIVFPGCHFASQFSPMEHPTRDQMIEFFEGYALQHALPIKFNAFVSQITRTSEGDFIVQVDNQSYRSQNVVCCIGPRHEAKFPLEAKRLCADASTAVIHSSDYRNPSSFEEGSRVLVVGSGLSALSLAQDIHDYGHQVTIACAYDDKEIQQRNPHIFKAKQPAGVIPTLSSLLDRGIKNVGRFMGIDSGKLLFRPQDEVDGYAKNTFDVVLFATGFSCSFTLLNKLLKLDETSDLDHVRTVHSHAIPGLFIAGIPSYNQQTVVITEGTQEAERIVEKISEQQFPSTESIKQKMCYKAKL